MLAPPARAKRLQWKIAFIRLFGVRDISLLSGANTMVKPVPRRNLHTCP